MSAKNPLPAPALDHVACPFCGLLCDDLRVSTAGEVLERGCARSSTMFAQSMDACAQCLVGGEPATSALAIGRAVELLRQSRQPIALCAGADVASLRALLDLAERCGAVVDHANSEALLRNLRVLQDSGWITTTLTEIRNRADFILCVGSDVVSRFPRFFERCAAGGGMLDESRAPPEILFLGAKPPVNITAQYIDVSPGRLCEFFSALRSRFHGQALQAEHIAGVPVSEISELLLRLRSARYAVLVWAAADLAFPHAELAIQSLCELIKDLNGSGRAAGLPLGGNDGDITAQQVLTWQSGFPLRTRLGSEGPRHDPYRYSAKCLLDSGEADALLFLSEMDTRRLPPPTSLPTIVLGRAGMTPPSCEVFISVGAPGLDRAGHLFRTDNVVAVPLRKLIDRKLPSAPEVLREIARQLYGEPG